MSSLQITLVSKSRVFPYQKSSLGKLKLSVSDLPMLSCHYIQKGLLFTLPPALSSQPLSALLKDALSQTLVHFPPLAGRLTTDDAGVIYIACNDAGVDFIHVKAGNLTLRDVLSPSHVPDAVKRFFAFDGAVSYDGHFRPLLAVQVTELSDGVFVGCSVNHAVSDGTSFWNFFNSWAELCRGVSISCPPNFRRDFVKDSPAVLKFPMGRPEVSFDASAPIRERIFRFSREAIRDLKIRVNGHVTSQPGNDVSAAEIMAKHNHDEPKLRRNSGETLSISSFQSLSAQLWRSVTRARKLNPSSETTFRMAVNCRHRVEPRTDPYYFGNAIQSLRTAALVRDVLSRDIRWSAELLNRDISAYKDETIRHVVEEWEREPRVFPLGNPDGASVTMGSSPRFAMYDNDFGWGRPLAVRSGSANKFDGKISAFPGRDGDGSVDLEVCLALDTMAALESDMEFMQYITT